MSRADILATVVEKIRGTIAEDWIADFEIGPGTRFSGDLEIESIEFVEIADALQEHFGTRLDIVGWLSGKSIQELTALSVGELADHIAASVP